MMQEKGFTLLELIIVIALMGILTAIALPNFLVWSRSARYREAASKIMVAMSVARAQAISTNREYRVVFNVAGNQYRLERGDLYSGSSWPDPPRSPNVPGWGSNWVAVPAGVALRRNADCAGVANLDFQFNPNGTSTAGHICVMTQDASTVKFIVGIDLSTTGRAKIESPAP